MKQDEQLMNKMFNGILITNVISVVAGIACVMIDAIVTGQFLGTEAVAATGLIQPVVMFINLVGALVCGGLGSVCTRYLGKAQTERVNQVFSIVTIACIVVTAVFALVIYVSAPWMGQFLGARSGSETIIKMITDYLKGFSFGIIQNRFTIMLASIMMLDNDKNRSIFAMGATLISDAVFDLANVMVFHGGMYGMAIATSLSNTVGLVVILTHYLRKNRVIHFTMKGLHLQDLYEVMLRGIPNAISMGSQALRNFVFNTLLLTIAGSGEVAALSVGNSAFSVVNAVLIGFFISSAIICSLLYGEEDRTGIEQALSIGIRRVMLVMTVITVVMVIFPQPIARLFVKSSDPGVLVQGARFIRFIAIQYFLSAMSFPISGAYQGTGKLELNYIIDVLREGIFPIVAVLLFGKLFGVHGMEIGFVVAGALTMAFCFFLPLKYNGRLPKARKDFLIWPEHFGADPEELFEASIHKQEDVAVVSEGVAEFCRKRHTGRRTAFLLALFVEEMAYNTVHYGFSKGEEGSINLKLICRKEEQIIRLRDDGRRFDPVDWYKKNSDENPASAMGIRMVVSLAKNIHYMAALEMNNLIVKL